MSLKRRMIQIILLLIGIACFTYPAVSGYINNLEHMKEIEAYNSYVDEVKDFSKEIEACAEYNKKLLKVLDRFKLSEENKAEYNKLMWSKGGIMGYVSVPKVGINLPIYHGTKTGTLSSGVGHLMGSSFPIQGNGVHAVLSGHAGLASERMFTNITALEIGDEFFVTSLGQTIKYEVDHMETVLPSEMDVLKIDPEENYCTLVTCTPIGINSHRYCVRGKLVDVSQNVPEKEKSTRVLTVVDKVNWGFVALGVLLLGYVVYLVVRIIRKKDDIDTIEKK